MTIFREQLHQELEFTESALFWSAKNDPEYLKVLQAHRHMLIRAADAEQSNPKIFVVGFFIGRIRRFLHL